MQRQGKANAYLEIISNHTYNSANIRPKFSKAIPIQRTQTHKYLRNIPLQHNKSKFYFPHFSSTIHGTAETRLC